MCCSVCIPNIAIRFKNVLKKSSRRVSRLPTSSWSSNLAAQKRRLWCHLRAIQDDHGDTAEIFGTLLDVTDYYQYKEEAEQVAQRLAVHLNQAPYAIVEWAPDSTIRQWTGTAEKLFGWSSEDAIGRTFGELHLVHPADLDHVNTILPKLFTGAASSVVSVNRNVRKDGKVIWCHWHNTILGESNTGDQSTLSIVLDVTEHIETQRALEESKQELVEAQKLAALGSWRWVEGTPGMSWSKGMYELWHADPRTHVTSIKGVFDSVHQDDRDQLRELVSSAIEHNRGYNTEFRIERLDGEERYIAASGKTMIDSGGQRSVLGICQDITERKKAEVALRRLAYRDALTGLGNRVLFTEQLAQRIGAGSQSTALVLLDLDHFKEVNDTLGHAAGDELLVQISRRLQQCVRPQDLVARLGGDEFAILLADEVSEKTVRSLTERILAAIAIPVPLSTSTVQVSGTVGIALAPGDGRTAAELLSHADLALYEAKDLGRSGYRFFKPELAVAAQGKLKGTNELREALRDDRLDVHYQAQVDLRRGKIGGFEALLRWPHPTRGFVPPSEFIPLAESTSLISELGEWVLRRACRDAVALAADAMADSHISVNVSAAQIWQCDFPAIAAAILEETGLHPSRLVLELTESIFVDQDRYNVAGFLKGIDALGVRLALDDFGCGYSSLGYLHDLPFDILKIDRHFVSDCESSSEKQKLLAGIVGLGHGLGFEVVAEGAETLEQVQILDEMNCDHIQGYYFGRPIPASQIDACACEIRESIIPTALHRQLLIDA